MYNNVSNFKLYNFKYRNNIGHLNFKNVHLLNIYIFSPHFNNKDQLLLIDMWRLSKMKQLLL